LRTDDPVFSHWIRKGTKRSLLKRGQARELPDGTLEEIARHRVNGHARSVFFDNVLRGEWRARPSGPFGISVMQFEAVRRFRFLP